MLPRVESSCEMLGTVAAVGGVYKTSGCHDIHRAKGIADTRLAQLASLLARSRTFISSSVTALLLTCFYFVVSSFEEPKPFYSLRTVLVSPL